MRNLILVILPLLTHHLIAQDGACTVAAGGYDVVSFFTSQEAQRGSRLHTSDFKGATYLFSSEANKKAFDASPEAYAPQFGGYCAYGVALGKKFVGDPNFWAIVDGKLFFNLNGDIQATWAKDRNAMIKTAFEKWSSIASVAPSNL